MEVLSTPRLEAIQRSRRGRCSQHLDSARGAPVRRERRLHEALTLRQCGYGGDIFVVEYDLDGIQI
jgi:hypothetical protein